MKTLLKRTTAAILRQARYNRAGQLRRSSERKDQAKTLRRWRANRGRLYARQIWSA